MCPNLSYSRWRKQLLKAILVNAFNCRFRIEKGARSLVIRWADRQTFPLPSINWPEHKLSHSEEAPPLWLSFIFIKDFLHILEPEKLPDVVTEFDEALWGSLVEKAAIYGKDDIRFLLIAGRRSKRDIRARRFTTSEVGRFFFVLG